MGFSCLTIHAVCLGAAWWRPLPQASGRDAIFRRDAEVHRDRLVCGLKDGVFRVDAVPDCVYADFFGSTNSFLHMHQVGIFPHERDLTVSDLEENEVFILIDLSGFCSRLRPCFGGYTVTLADHVDDLHIETILVG